MERRQTCSGCSLSLLPEGGMGSSSLLEEKGRGCTCWLLAQVRVAFLQLKGGERAHSRTKSRVQFPEGGRGAVCLSVSFTFAWVFKLQTDRLGISKQESARGLLYERIATSAFLPLHFRLVQLLHNLICPGAGARPIEVWGPGQPLHSPCPKFPPGHRQVRISQRYLWIVILTCYTGLM